ncbi:MAG TPA: zinc-binding dehydrogenase [Solimonas sp.]|nr:zinc-binding dehydrogenase [Solimonas sp.]
MGHILNIHEVDDVRLDAYQRPEAGTRDVVVKVKACGVCGSDLTYVKLGGIHRKPGGVTPLGHEAAGEVMFVGKEIDNLAVGQRVIINPMMTPSYIGSGGPEGAFTEELLVRGARLGESLLPIPDGLPYDIAAMTEPLAVALHGVNRMQVRPGDKAVVFGCGPIGLGMVLWLVDRGVTDVVALDLAPERLARARALGARAAFDPTKEDLRARLSELHGTGRVFSRETVGTDAFIDAAGAPNILSDVVRLAKFQSRMVVTAAHSKPVPLDLGAMLTTEMTITTAVCYPTEMPDVIKALPRLRDKIAGLISHRFPFEKVIDAFGVAASPASAKVMVEFDERVT